MKIFVWEANYPNFGGSADTHAAVRNKAAESAFLCNDEPYFYLKPDSSLLKDGKPFFLPDHLTDIRIGIHVVVKVGRLGKSISVRFAHRYYEEVTVGASLVACGELEGLCARGLPWDLAVGFDGAALLGRFIRKPLDLDFEMRINDCTVQRGSVKDLKQQIDEGIAHISQYYILKTGDLVYTGCPTLPVAIKIGDRIEGYINDEKLLDFYIR